MTEKRPTLSIKRKPTNPIAKVQPKAEYTTTGKPATPSEPPKAPNTGKSAKSLTETLATSEQTPLSKAERIGRTRAKKIRQGEAALLLLSQFWPESFSFSDPKPLKIGIKEDLITDAKARELDISRNQITAALMVYINRAEYRSAIARGGQRNDLHGHPAGDVGEKAMEHAKVKLEKPNARGENSE